MPSCGRATLALIALIGLPASAEAQNAAPQGKWTIEFYGGRSLGSDSSSGTPLANFPGGGPFTLESGRPSRVVPSWFFGDGAVLFNQVVAQFATGTGTTFPRIVPLDAALRADAGKLGSGGVFGVRVGRDLTPTLTAEFSVERSLAKVALRDSLLNGLDTGGDSFIAAFETFLGTLPVTSLDVTSTVTTTDDQNAQLRVTGALKWTVLNGSRVKGYLTGGGGLIRNSGDGPQATLRGRYSFTLFGNFPMEESDVVVVTVNQPKYNAMGLLGGGVTYALSSSSGLRADVRLLLSSSKELTTLTTFPAFAALNPPLVLSTSPDISPGIQFSSQPAVRSSLSAPIENLKVFTGSGLDKHVSFTLGVFKRF